MHNSSNHTAVNEHGIYAVKDIKAELFKRPYVVNLEIDARRAFDSAVNDPMSQIHQFPQDFQLYKIGVFNENNGEIKTMAPTLITDALSVYRKIDGESEVHIRKIKEGHLGRLTDEEKRAIADEVRRSGN